MKSKQMRLFIDGSVNPQLKTGFGAYLLLDGNSMEATLLEPLIKVKKFEETSSTKLELETLLWALDEIVADRSITIYTDCQNILGLSRRREGFEQNDYYSKRGKRITNYELYEAFYKVTDRLTCDFVKLKGHKRSHEKDLLDDLFTLVDRAARTALREYSVTS